jgi:hypothetical protein
MSSVLVTGWETGSAGAACGGWVAGGRVPFPDLAGCLVGWEGGGELPGLKNDFIKAAYLLSICRTVWGGTGFLGARSKGRRIDHLTIFPLARR